MSAQESIQPPISAQMNVKKRNGALEPVDLNKIVKAVSRCAEGITDVDPYRVALNTIGSLKDGATTEELDRRSIATAASLIPSHANYSKLAAAILAEVIRKEVARDGIHTFSQSIVRAHQLGLVSDGMLTEVNSMARKLDNAVKEGDIRNFEYYGLQNIYENHLLRDPETREVIETPQHMLMRKAMQFAYKDAAVNQSHPSGRVIKVYREIVADPLVMLKMLPAG